MQGDVSFGPANLLGFLLCLARVAGISVLVPIPGFRNGPDSARIVLALTISLILAPVWPVPPGPTPSTLQLAGWVISQAVVGMGIGLAVALLMEGFQLAAQVLGLQAGYSYASTIDPSSQADSGILQVWMQFATGFLFFAAGLDHLVIRALASGAAHAAPWKVATATAAVAQLGSAMFSVGVRLAFPVVALVLLLDIALALTGRMQAQLQLLSLAFPAKMIAVVLLLSVLTATFPTVFEKAAELTFRTLPALGQ